MILGQLLLNRVERLNADFARIRAQSQAVADLARALDFVPQEKAGLPPSGDRVQVRQVRSGIPGREAGYSCHGSASGEPFGRTVRRYATSCPVTGSSAGAAAGGEGSLVALDTAQVRPRGGRASAR